MKISCQSCQAKYTIADDKVVGKIVKIRCKKCSSTIVINGNETSGGDSVDAQSFDHNEQWMVNVADGDQRTLSIADLVREYQDGVVNDDTFCWKDGMADWLPIREIDPLYAAVSGGRAQAYSDEEAIPASSAGPLFGDGGYDNGGGDYANEGADPGGALFGASEPAPTSTRAARVGGRNAGGADLFGDAALAGGEDFGRAAPPPSSDPKLTGSRNENSVLFSLSALTSDGKPSSSESSGSGKADGNRTTAQADGSGLIDIKALANSMGDSDRKKDKSQVDDIMNLSGGGAFGTSALAAPILAPPPMDASSHSEGSDGGGKTNKGMMFGLLGAGALVAIGLVVAVVMMKQPTPAGNPSGATSGGPMATTTVDPAGTNTVATNPTPTAPTAAAPTGAEPKNPLAVAANGGGAAPKAGGGGGGAAPKAGGGGGGSVVSPPSEPAPTPAQPAQPTSLGAAMAQAAGAKTGGGGDAPAAGGSAPFDRGAAAAALSGVNVASCKKGDGPTGSGHVTVIFAPNGSVKSATVDSSPFEGTPVGGCIAGKFRAAHVPAFSGGEVKVGKSFTLN